jgi:hypothetical protein
LYGVKVLHVHRVTLERVALHDVVNGEFAAERLALSLCDLVVFVDNHWEEVAEVPLDHVSEIALGDPCPVLANNMREALVHNGLNLVNLQ